ncbi:arylesterase [Robertkochia marina]|uniref:Arylesterase n=2 Tax=Robertkochia marina TaxID=1227945 RepID=A0A4S3M6Y5_9FLAO|nr:arylesterase [Robertkochia marina]TRZ47669.1 arylesterase [Robertkochia marina]
MGCKKGAESDRQGVGSRESGVVNDTTQQDQKATDSWSSETDSEWNKETAKGTKNIVFFGNSLTAGMGLDTQEAFPALIQNRLDSLGLDYQVVNAGLSGDTTASGLSRLDWILENEVDVFVLELGANDGLRGIPLTETRKNLQAIIDKVKAKYPDTTIILAGMQIPPNLGEEYTTEFRRLFGELAQKNDLALIPFLLQGVAGDPELNQEDGIHPTAEGQKILADNVWEVLREVVDN